MTPGMLRDVVAYVKKHRSSDEPFAVVVSGETSSDAGQEAEVVQPYAEAGATWWMEGFHGWRGSLEANRTRLRAGPPR